MYVNKNTKLVVRILASERVRLIWELIRNQSGLAVTEIQIHLVTKRSIYAGNTDLMSAPPWRRTKREGVGEGQHTKIYMLDFITSMIEPSTDAIKVVDPDFFKTGKTMCHSLAIKLRAVVKIVVLVARFLMMILTRRMAIHLINIHQ